MSAAAAFAIVVYVALLALLAWPLGAACARALAGERTWLSRLLGPLERAIYRFAGVRPADEMDWRLYARAFLLFSLASTAALYLLLRVQHLLPGWPAAYPPIRPDLAFNIAASFSTNTNWQSYSGEGTVGYVVAALGLIVQNFVSPAAGLAVLLALIRGFARRTAATVGNFWADLVRATLYVMLPAALVLAVLLISQGVVQTWGGARDVPLLQPTTGEGGKPVA
ncbi:MAG TPA: potassium-transporting ATPase subunit KdpA, partial [Acidobacteriota bacterium]|nr:potassium-transporting ATPase subunit KdpA [Acidobacteriota bacterium]